MKSLPLTLALVVLLGVAVAALVSALGFEEGERLSAHLGVLVATGLGLVSLLVKTQLAGRITEGQAGLKALLVAQGFSFLLRLLAVAAGIFALRSEPSASPIAFVITFFVVSLAQQALEMRSLLAARSTPVTS